MVERSITVDIRREADPTVSTQHHVQFEGFGDTQADVMACRFAHGCKLSTNFGSRGEFVDPVNWLALAAAMTL